MATVTISAGTGVRARRGGSGPRAEIVRAGAAGRREPVRPTHPQPVRLTRPQPVRLTRRGRLVLTLVLTCVLAVIALALTRTTATATPGRGTAPDVASVVVAPGDTLWSLARDMAPGEDPRRTVAAIASLNDVDPDAALTAGRQILVPSAH